MTEAVTLDKIPWKYHEVYADEQQKTRAPIPVGGPDEVLDTSVVATPRIEGVQVSHVGYLFGMHQRQQIACFPKAVSDFDPTCISLGTVAELEAKEIDDRAVKALIDQICRFMKNSREVMNKRGAGFFS